MADEDTSKEIRHFIEELKKAERFGSMNDEPEGSRYLKISDTLAQELIECLQGMQILFAVTSYKPGDWYEKKNELIL